MDGDGKVTFADFQALELNFGKTSATWQTGDFTNDGKVDNADFNALRANFGADLSAAAAPVPSTPISTPAPTPVPVTQTPISTRKPAPAKRPTPVPARPFSAKRISKKPMDSLLV
jgi:hypothetical protein